MVTYKPKAPFTKDNKNFDVYYFNHHIGWIDVGVLGRYGFRSITNHPFIDEETILSIGAKLKELNK